MGKILLVHPDCGCKKIGFSLTLGSIGGSLKQKGHRVSYILFDLYWNGRRQLYRSIKDVDMIGITISSGDFDSAIGILNEIREIKPDIPIVAGAPHATFDPESLLVNGFNVCVRGEGEYIINDVVESFEQKQSDLEEFRKIKGISFITSSGKIFHNENREIIENLDLLPFPDWYQDDYKRIFLESYIPFNDPLKESISESVACTLMIESSRGCPFNCIYCTTSKIKGKKWRAKSPTRIIEEYIRFKEFYFEVMEDYFYPKKIYIQFPDDNFCFDKSRVNAICKEILELPEKDRPLWTIMARADNIDDIQLLNIMKKSGCIRIFMGAECGYSKGLKRIKKGISLEMIHKAVDAILNVDFPFLIVSWIVGFPWEKKQHSINTIITALKIALKNPNIIKTSIFTFTPFAGAEVTKSIGESVKGRSSDPSRYITWGFNHPNMSDNDLVELQMVAHYFVFLLNNYYKIDVKKDFVDYIRKAIDFSGEIITIIEDRNLKVLFKHINQFFSSRLNEHEKKIEDLKEKIFSWVEFVQNKKHESLH